MPDPKVGGAYIERDPRKPYVRRLVVLNTNRKVAASQWINEATIAALAQQLQLAEEEIESEHENARQLADQILGRDRQ